MWTQESGNILYQKTSNILKNISLTHSYKMNMQ